MTAKPNIPRMQHYLPQGYLKGFTAHGHQSKNGTLRAIDLLERRSFGCRPKDVAKIRDYYAFESVNGGLDYRIETELFQRVDNDAATLLRRIDETRKLPTGEDWSAFCVFLAFVQVRTPQLRHANLEVAQHLFNVVSAATCRTPEAFEAFQKQHKERTGEDLGGTFEDAKQLIESGELVAEVPQNYHIELMLHIAPKLASVMVKMTPHLMVAVGKGRFITSDAPIHCFDCNEQRRESGLVGVGWLTPEVEATFPLTKDCCLVLTHGGKSKVFEAGDLEVANCNLMRASMARQYLFAPQIDVPLLWKGEVVWGESEFLEKFAEMKRTQPAMRINGGGIVQKPIHHPRR